MVNASNIFLRNDNLSRALTDTILTSQKILQKCYFKKEEKVALNNNILCYRLLLIWII